MKFIKSLFGIKKPAQEPLSLETECQQVILALQEELPEKVSLLRDSWRELGECALALEGDALETGVEACLWALIFLKMVEEAEGLGIGGDGISTRLEWIQEVVDEQGKGCKVRYARGILQDYAASGRGYESKQKALFVGEWLFNCNKDATQSESSVGSVGSYRRLGELLLGDDSERSWFGTDRISKG
jgi:hypothetical protein